MTSHHADADEFISRLRPGDVLVYDQLGLDAGLIQWGDRAAASHCALVLDQETLIEANRHTDEHPHAVRRKDLRDDLVNTDADTTISVTALRLQAVDDAALTRVLEAATSLDGSGEFSFLDIGFLTLSAFRRSYGQGLEETPFGRLLRWLARWCASHIPEDGATLTCSEFVYRCFDAAGLVILVEGPLFAPDFVPGADLEAQLWEKLARVNDGRKDDTSFASSTHPDRVTPGDLWASTSFERVAQLHYVQVQHPRSY